MGSGRSGRSSTTSGTRRPSVSANAYWQRVGDRDQWCRREGLTQLFGAAVELLLTLVIEIMSCLGIG